MTSSRLGPWTLVLLGAMSAGACGNYSNEDLDFQLALPQRSDMEAKMQLSLTRADSAEYYLATRKAITSFNTVVVDLVSLIEFVRGQSPTSRNGAERVWGPFPSDKYPDWEFRVVMERSTASPELLHMDYWIQVRPVGQGDSAWASFLVGNYTSQGSARTGTGEIHLLANEPRAAGYPVDADPGLVNLDHLDVTYNNAIYPFSVTLDIVNLPAAATQAGHYQYLQAQDGSGSMVFNWQGVTDTGTPITATMQAEWQGSGAGRADLTADLTPNLPNQSTTLGTDCWGVDTVATYSYRREGGTTSGTAASCLF